MTFMTPDPVGGTPRPRKNEIFCAINALLDSADPADVLTWHKERQRYHMQDLCTLVEATEGMFMSDNTAHPMVRLRENIGSQEFRDVLSQRVLPLMLSTWAACVAMLDKYNRKHGQGIDSFQAFGPFDFEWVPDFVTHYVLWDGVGPLPGTHCVKGWQDIARNKITSAAHTDKAERAYRSAIYKAP